MIPLKYLLHTLLVNEEINLWPVICVPWKQKKSHKRNVVEITMKMFFLPNFIIYSCYVCKLITAFERKVNNSENCV